MSPNGGGEPGGKLLAAIEKSFGSFEEFKQLFSTAAATQFGSGWAWLVLDEEGGLQVTATPNQDNSLMDIATDDALFIFEVPSFDGLIQRLATPYVDHKF